MKFEFNKIEAKKAAKFLVALAILYFALYYTIIYSVGLQPLESAAAQGSVIALNALGENARISSTQEPVQLSVQGKTIEISELCTGLLETLLVFSAVVASFGISWKKRALGAVAAIFAIYVFNIVRIAASVMQILSTPIEFADLTHNLLFRASLFAVIAGYYFVWFRWAIKQKE